MADAGRILIIPRGDFNANSTYEKLDLVKYNGTTWLAKKDTTGVVPSDANEEYWQKMFEVEIANNLTTTMEGASLDARQGKVLDEKISTQVQTLNDKITGVNNNLTKLSKKWTIVNDFATALNLSAEEIIIAISFVISNVTHTVSFYVVVTDQIWVTRLVGGGGDIYVQCDVNFPIKSITPVVMYKDAQINEITTAVVCKV